MFKGHGHKVFDDMVSSFRCDALHLSQDQQGVWPYLALLVLLVDPWLIKEHPCGGVRLLHTSSCRLDLPHLGYCRVEAAESLVSVTPVLLGKLDTMYLEPFGTGCLTTNFPFLVSARNRLYQ